MNQSKRGLWIALCLVLGWRVALLCFTGQPIPANDAFPFDGPVVNWLSGGGYCNPSIAECFDISGTQVFSMYPPLYQAALLVWMWLFGTSVLASMAFHLCLFATSATLVVLLIARTLPDVRGNWLAIMFLLAVTFNDRPDDLAHPLGLGSLLLAVSSLDHRTNRRLLAISLTLTLLAGLYTSPVVGALYFGAALLVCVIARLWNRSPILWLPFAATPVLAIGIAVAIAKFHPLAWQGFIENSRQTPVLAAGFRMPSVVELIKLLRNAPVFFLILACLPVCWVWRRRLFSIEPRSSDDRWIALTGGLAIAGWMLLLGTVALFTANYVTYVLYAQVVLAASLLVLAEACPSKLRFVVRLALVGCLLLVSVRAIGMSTWGAACARDVGRSQALAAVRDEMRSPDLPDGRFVMSSAYLYEAWRMDRRDALHTDWIRDRRDSALDADVQALIRLRPSRLFLTQFDHYRVYQHILAQLGQHPDLVTITIRNTAKVPAPDSIPSLQRVVQHIAWAPVIVELDWK